MFRHSSAGNTLKKILDIYLDSHFFYIKELPRLIRSLATFKLIFGKLTLDPSNFFFKLCLNTELLVCRLEDNFSEAHMGNWHFCCFYGEGFWYRRMSERYKIKTLLKLS